MMDKKQYIELCCVMANLKTARSLMLSSASRVDELGVVGVHQSVMGSIAHNDQAQDKLHEMLAADEPIAFESSMPERCEYVEYLSSIPANMDRRCMKEAGHEGPHMFGELDPPPAA